VAIYLNNSIVAVNLPDIGIVRARITRDPRTESLRAYRRNHPEYNDNNVDRYWAHESFLQCGMPLNSRTLMREAREAWLSAQETVAACEPEAWSYIDTYNTVFPGGNYDSMSYSYSLMAAMCGVEWEQCDGYARTFAPGTFDEWD
jgi:hypothetical protein